MNQLLRFTVLLLVILAGFNIARAQWDGTPLSPQPASTHGEFANFDITSWIADPADWYSQSSFNASHGSACQGPPAQHSVSSFEDAVFVCSNHLMTSVNGSSYGGVYVTPNRLLDWTNGSASLDFDMSTVFDSSRDWWDLGIQPWGNINTIWSELATNIFPKTGYQVHAVGGVFELAKWTNWQKLEVVPFNRDPAKNQSAGITSGTNQAAVRQPFRLTISRTHLRFERLQSTTGSPVVFIDTNIPDTLIDGYTSATVTWAQHSYNPTKDSAGIPATWHIDEFHMACNPSPCRTITMIKASKRIVPEFVHGDWQHIWDNRPPFNVAPGPFEFDVRFNAPAPANAFLKFECVETCEVSYNGGQTWNSVVKTSDPNTPYPQHSQIFTPVSPNVQNIKIRFRSAGHPFPHPPKAQDLSIWSLGGQTPSTPTPVPATSTATSVPPSPSATMTPTLVPAPSATASATPTATLSPQPTQTATTQPTSTATATTPPATSTPQPTATPSLATTTCYQGFPQFHRVNGKWAVTGVEVPC